MAIDYKRELENAAKTMILVHEPDTLIRMIVRMIVHKVKVRHAAILLHDQSKDTYVLTVSRGASGLKIPQGFARMDTDNPLIRFFRERVDKQVLNDGAVCCDDIKKCLKRNKAKPQVLRLLKGALSQMEMFEVTACIPSYFREDLLGILLLGNKKNGRKFGRDELDFLIALTFDVAMAIRNAELFKGLELELERNKRLFIHTTIALAAAIEAKDHYTHGHTERVTDLSLQIARKLKDKNRGMFKDNFFEHLRMAGLLHDIGKIGIPESILNKNGPLNQEEKARMQEHPLVGVTILQPIRELEEALAGVKYHHEKYDGTGYPEGLKGERIPLIASIISVADTFDAMTTDRPYHKMLSAKEAVDEIKRLSGRQFEPDVAGALIELYQENKI